MEVKFVNYSGSYPNLCSGILVLEVDGKEFSFGYNSYNDKIKVDFPRFWTSGGGAGLKNYTEYVEKGEWEIFNYSNETDEIIDFFGKDNQPLEKFIEIFNENVPYGCCGGCI